jgi:hypothetical protein
MTALSAFAWVVRLRTNSASDWRFAINEGLTTKQIFDVFARSFLRLLAERWYRAGAFVSIYALDAPGGKEQISESNKRLVVNERADPIIKRIQVETAQEYSSRVNFVEHSPAFFAWRVKHNHDWIAGLNFGAHAAAKV